MTAEVNELSMMGEISKEAPKEEQDYLNEYVGEGKKYSSVEEAARALAKKAAHADQFIETLKSEKQQVESALNEERGKSKTAQELLELIQNQQQPAEDYNRAGGEQEETQRQSLTREDVVSLTEQLMAKKEEKIRKEETFRRSWETLGTEFGSIDNARELMKKFVELDPASNRILVETIGVTNPKKLAKMIRDEVDIPRETFSPNIESNVPRVKPYVPSGMTWSKAKEIKKNKPNQYNSMRFQQEMQQAISNDSNFYTK